MIRIEKKVAEIVKENFKETSIKILELCPGRGLLTRDLLNAGYGNIEALDINPDNFEVKEVKIHEGNLNEELPFQDEKFDLILIVEGIEHLEYQYRFASECNRILKKNGSLILTTPNIDNFASRLKFLFTGFYSLCVRPLNEFQKDWAVEHIYLLTFWQLRHILHTNGLFIKQITTDHIRRSALIGLIFWPISLLITWMNLRKEKDERQFKANLQILSQMHSPTLYFGRTQILVARKEPSSYIKDNGNSNRTRESQ